MKTWIVLVNNGYRYEYETEITAPSARKARESWKRRGDHKTRDFRVTQKKGA